MGYEGCALACYPTAEFIDAVDKPTVRAFWMAVLGYRHGSYARLAQDIYDPRRLNPVLWFQQADKDEPRWAQRNRTRVELFVGPDEAQRRIDAALAAGGRLVDASGTVADPEGNEVVLRATPGGRW